MNSKEAKIRDQLSSRLELLEPGLQLISIEQFLPNPQGTKGFVDLFARDVAGKHVLIELKRSAGASREALHEVLKYLEAVKVGLSSRDSEIRIFIVSTEWSELLVPFSSFVKRTSCEVLGYALEVSPENIPTKATLITPINLVEDRLFAPWHELCLYISEKSLKKGIKSYEKNCKSNGIDNFVLVVLEPPLGHHQRSAEAIQKYLKHLPETLGFPDRADEPAAIAKHIPEYTHMLYFATLQLSEALCWEAIRRTLDAEDLEEFEAYVSETESDEERLCALHNKVCELEPDKHFDHFEIGYPSKFAHTVLSKEQWTITKIIRHGTLAANKSLSEEAIINDLKGEDGNHPTKYFKLFSTSNKSELIEVCAGVKRCLRDNQLWRNQILRVINDFLPAKESATATISIFNPANLCLALYLYLTQEDGNDYIPIYTLNLDIPGEQPPLFFGVLQPTGIAPSFTTLLRDHFDGSEEHFLMNLSWGGYLSSDVEIAQSMGMTYKTFKLETEEGKRSFWELTELGWKTHPPLNHILNFQHFIKNHPAFILDIVEFYSSHWDGVIWKTDPDSTKSKFRT